MNSKRRQEKETNSIKAEQSGEWSFNFKQSKALILNVG
jgi:hypothetical protein